MSASTDNIAFVDLAAQQARIRDRLDAAIARVLDHGKYIMGPEVGEFERQLTDCCGAKHAVTCASGTDALLMALLAHGVGAGDAVIVPTFTFVATAEVVSLLGATPVFVDVDERTFNMRSEQVEPALALARERGLNPRAVIPVDLFGQPADYPAINAIAEREGLLVIGDAAQSFGATLHGEQVGTLAPVTTTSFFPAKPLGCYGDGGAILTDDDEFADRLRSIRVHGKGSDKYDNVRIGVNGRIDTLQAAILIEKLSIFAEEIALRDAAANRYRDGLHNVLEVPVLAEGASSVWAQYTVKTPARDALVARLKAAGVPTAVYYPTPLHLQTAYAGATCVGAGCPVSEALAGEVLSLPMHPYLDAAVQARIVDAVRG